MNDIFELSRNWWEYAAQNRVKPIHNALYFYIINKANTLHWKPEIGLPTEYTVMCLGTYYKAYKSALEDLESFGFIRIVERSKNQHTSLVIALVNLTKADTKAITKADTKALPKQLPKQLQDNKTSKNSKESKNSKDVAAPPPSFDEVLKYVLEKKFIRALAENFFQYYSDTKWTKKNGEAVKNWKLTMNTWMNEPHNQKFKSPETTSRYRPFDPTRDI